MTAIVMLESLSRTHSIRLLSGNHDRKHEIGSIGYNARTRLVPIR